MKTEQFQEKQSQMPNKELILLAREEVSKLCKTGGKSIRMCVPPSVKDTDMLLCEVIKRLEDLTKYIQENCIKALEKEKEQIINFGLKVKNEAGVEAYSKVLKTYDSTFGGSNEAGI